MKRIKIVCPECHADLKRKSDQDLICEKCGNHYPQRATVDVLMTESEWRNHQKEISLQKEAKEEYSFVRRKSLLTNMYYDMWVSRLLSKLPQQFDGVVLELMAGECEISRRLPPNVIESAAIDLNVEFIEQAKNYFDSVGEKRVVTISSLAEKLPFPDEHFDAIFVQGGLHHARPVMQQVLSEVHRVLRPGGYFIGSEPANDFWLIQKIRQIQYKYSQYQGNDEGEDGFTSNELKQLFSESNLNLIEYERFGFFAYMGMGNLDVFPLLKHFQWQWLGKLLMFVDQILERTPLLQEFAWASIFWATK